jgi:prefoldin subunit 4
MSRILTLTDRMLQLAKEDEAGPGEDIEVRREDQEKINKFSRLHQHSATLEEKLKQKQVGKILLGVRSVGRLTRPFTLQKDKEDLQEISNDLEELELLDEDAKVP